MSEEVALLPVRQMYSRHQTNYFQEFIDTFSFVLVDLVWDDRP
jgi:hypothetical protein